MCADACLKGVPLGITRNFDSMRTRSFSLAGAISLSPPGFNRLIVSSKGLSLWH